MLIQIPSKDKLIYFMLHSLLKLLFPTICFACERKTRGNILCQSCYDRIKFVTPPTCKLCGKEISIKRSICQSCLKKRCYYDFILSCVHYTFPIPELIHYLKYYHYDYLYRFLGAIMVTALKNIGFAWEECCDILTYVPMHPTRLRERGYNQSYLLAKYISEVFSFPLYNILICQRAKRSQTELKPHQRYENVKDIFITNQNIDGSKVLIIDDIFTTGATLSECAKALKKAGAKQVVGLTLAKAEVDTT